MCYTMLCYRHVYLLIIIVFTSEMICDRYDTQSQYYCMYIQLSMAAAGLTHGTVAYSLP